MKIKDLNNMTRDEQNALIWRHTHKDSRGVIGGTKTILVGRIGQGTCLVSLDALTDEERTEQVKIAVRREKTKKGLI